MNGDVRPSVNKILTAIESGNLSKEETIRRIEALVEEETNKPDAQADLDLICACEDLLEELNLHKSISLEDHMAATKQQVAARIQQTTRSRKAWKAVARTAAVAAAIMVLAVAIDVIFDRGWFKQFSTVDEQQYVVQGEATDPNLLDESAAEDTGIPSEIVTTSYSELVSFLGYEPILPTWLPENLQFEKYQANRHSNEEIIVVPYLDTTSGQTIQYMQACYDQIEEANLSFEQTAEGELLTVDSIKVYRAVNIKRVRYNWSIGSNVFTLSGTLTDKDAIKIIQSTSEEYRNVQKNE